ncbi:DEAD/DEAH box helicase [Planomicrobium sp. CPCC 101110]|uniref:DEAD/DEAH box helicase n=1 Tax=Planomicrobium sp. CPCC 101110 TaxID=2599619 RepID=UPI0011B4E768|nr:DEAD/DEAH box helicase [Planomicrobium sp. CPCC 101110]TWT25302.1 ATP-dependent DNA helicase RecQ [Planomicrobium sp. CPCC 101110]
MNIEKKIEEITEQNGSSIIVLKGFDTSELKTEKKYFSFDIGYLDKVDLSMLKEQVIEDIIQNRTFTNSYLWMSIEEYQLFKDQKAINKMPVVVIENNLFNKQYPYKGTLSNVESIYHYLYYQEDNELENDQMKILENVSKFYGQIDYSKQSGNYYVTYPEFDDKPLTFKYFVEKDYNVNFSENYPEENILQIELSDDELPFLDLIMNTISKDKTKNVLCILSGTDELIPNNYLSRINILTNISDFKFFFTTLSIKRKVIENEFAYKKILKEIYGYENFKEIEFYKNIENQNKETIEISQAQIIDDIVIHAEKAMHGEDFRDVYITAATGAGKSVMFQIPALYLANKYVDDKPLTLVISPLIGLMNDQVDSMKRKGIENSATINGNTPPYEKESILDKIQNQQVDILYLSPETLQARSDIKMLIGNRNIGVVIIDEAHIVTTWGKTFRSDYWYLGIYLAKLRKEYKFPIVTFTATAIYGGREDMYLDTRNSLNMISPISYFGKVRRDEILMIVKSSEKDLEKEGRDYRKTKHTLALRHIERAYKNKQKSLIYFPTVKLLMDFNNFLTQNAPNLVEITGKYHGGLKKEEKDEVLYQYITGDLQYVLATKAFGMGIDIPDITNVYHYAPTGNVVDYIQEIGRAARDKNKVINGFGIIDFLNRDMNEVKQLYGMSAIRKSQILEVMKKVLSVYKEKNNNRNLIISPEDFKYIFVQNKRDEDSLDNKVKTVLLMIEKDFSSPNKLGYSPFVARPRSLFGNDLILVTSELERTLTRSNLGKYFSKLYEIQSETYSAIYQVNLSEIWEKYYRSMSFPSFKFSLYSAEEREKLKHKSIFEKFIYVSGVEVGLNNNETVESIVSEYNLILQAFETFVNNYKISGKQFSVDDLGYHFMKVLKIADRFEAMTFAQTVINAAFEYSKIKEIKFINERASTGDSKPKYLIHNEVDLFTTFIKRGLLATLKPNNNFVEYEGALLSFSIRANSTELDAKLAALGIGESRNLLNYQVVGGNNPQIYLRMNSIYPLEKAIKQGDFYQNSILKDVQDKHYTSVEMLKYLFTKEQEGNTPREKILNYSKWFWDNTEDYFMGILPSEVKNVLSRPRK